MSVAIATMGYFNPSIGTGNGVEGFITGGGGGAGYPEELYRKKPVIIVRDVDAKTKKRPIIEIIEVETL